MKPQTSRTHSSPQNHELKIVCAGCVVFSFVLLFVSACLLPLSCVCLCTLVAACSLLRCAVLSLLCTLLRCFTAAFTGGRPVELAGGLCGVEDDNVRFALAVLLMQVGERLAYLHPHHAVEPLLVVVIFLRRRCLLRCRGLRAFAAGETQGNYQRERRKVFSPLLF